MDRVLRIALFARRFRLLADRVEFLKPDPGERIETTLREQRAIPLSFLDQVQVAGSGQLDRVCAAAVRRLRSYHKGKVALLDVLGVMDPDRICAIYYAMPEKVRDRLLSDPTFAYHVRQVEADMPDALAEVEELARIGDEHAKSRAEIVAEMSGEDQAALERVERGSARRRAGLDHDLTEDELAVIDGRA